MVMVDVEVPALDRVYDFELEKEALTGELTEKIVTLIVQNSGLLKEQSEELYLYALQQEKILNPKMTLKQQGIQNGDRLVLI